MFKITEEKTRTYAPWIALFSFFATATFAYLQYDASIRRDRRSIAFELMKTYQGKEMFEARVNLEVLLVEDKIAARRKQLAPGNRDRFLLEFVDGEKVRKDFRRLVTFYDQVASCVAAGLCDKELVRRFFICDMKAFDDFFIEALAEKWEANLESDGLAMDNLVVRWSGTPCTLRAQALERAPKIQRR
jgi:hypothetical protein